MEHVSQDLRYAVRQLRRAPGFAAAFILVIGLGVGASTAVFTLVDGILLRPLGLPDADRLVTLCEAHDAELDYCTASPPNVTDWAARATTLEAVGLARWRGVTFTGPGSERDRAAGAMATPGFLRALGVAPLHGRLLEEDDMLPLGASRAVVLSYELWRDRFGADPGVVGRTTRVSSDGDGQILDDDEVLIVGVLPEGTEVPFFGDVEAWLPLQFDPATPDHRGWRGFQTLARLRPGIERDAAQAELNSIQRQLAEAYPDELRGWRVEAIGARERIVANVREMLLLFLGAVALVLLIVCVNLVGLLLARAVIREREFAVRLSLGAARRRVAAQLLTEGALLTILGGVAGVLIAAWLVRGFVLLAPPGTPRLDEVGLDLRVLGFALLVTATLALVFGLAPAVRLGRVSLPSVLASMRGTGGRGMASTVARRLLVLGQLGLALALVLTAVLLLRSFERQMRFDPGFDIDGLTAFAVYPAMARYPTPGDRVAVYDRIAAGIEGIPGVVAVGTSSAGPLFGGGDGAVPFLVAGRDNPPLQDAPRLEWYDAGADYVVTLGIPVVEGRNFSIDDVPGATPAALVNESAAHAYWPGESPVGATLSLPDFDVDARVVGVIADTRLSHDEAEARPSIYVNNRQRPRGGTYFVVRSEVPFTTLGPAIESALRAVDPELAASDLRPLTERLSQRLLAPRFNAALITFFALVALALSAIGLYAITDYMVAARTREFGIRFALGASRARVLRAVLAEGIALVAVGVAVGAVAAFWFTRLLRGLIAGIAPGDPLSIAVTLAVMTAAGVLASIGPALRASRIEPATAMRSE